MKNILIFLMFFCYSGSAWAMDEIWLPNIPGFATGTHTGSSNALDVNVAAGTITATNPSVGPTGSAVPADATFMGAKNNSGNLVGLLTGQQTMANSLACVLPSDQSAIPVSQSGTWNITNISGTVSLPTGASTSANQTNGNQKSQIVDGSGNVIASTSNALNVQVSNFPATQPVSGTVAVTQSTSPWVSNVSQFGGNNVVTGTGASGVGIPRVTISNDSSLAAHQSVNVDQIGGGSLSLGQKTEANSVPVTIASDQVAPKTYANSSGSFVLNTTLTTVVSETCPSGGVGYILEASSSNGNNIRWDLGATATTSSGMRLEPGRDTGFVPVCATISIVSESGTNEYELTWIKQ